MFLTPRAPETITAHPPLSCACVQMELSVRTDPLLSGVDLDR